MPSWSQSTARTPWDLIALLIELGRAEFDVDDVEESLAYFDRASDLVGRQDQALYRAKKNTDIAKILRDLVAAVDYFNAALTAFDGAGPMNQGELSVRQLLVDVLSRLGREDEATPHCVALGEHQDVTQPPKVLFEAPVGVERGQLREVMGGEITVAFHGGCRWFRLQSTYHQFHRRDPQRGCAGSRIAISLCPPFC